MHRPDRLESLRPVSAASMAGRISARIPVRWSRHGGHWGDWYRARPDGAIRAGFLPLIAAKWRLNGRI
ncbi:hypothetical protein [Jeongeupia naejangsanensis]|uniref:Uncharacterized protein n=1 Tax=Jeongeupia naejangsanensis TaxID=613195 RepID=A0ABS2BLY4_9NEIS|nr:hypothetical protein [Jeongeupia naejangsanensis]MBM3115789.1 hypothetical protein [Jeongeupia naejangsanensis]